MLFSTRPLQSCCGEKHLWGPKWGSGAECKYYGKYSCGHREFINSPRHLKPGTQKLLHIPIP